MRAALAAGLVDAAAPESPQAPPRRRRDDRKAAQEELGIDSGVADIKVRAVRALAVPSV